MRLEQFFSLDNFFQNEKGIGVVLTNYLLLGLIVLNPASLALG